MFNKSPRRIFSASTLTLCLAVLLLPSIASGLARSYLTSDPSIEVGMVVATASNIDGAANGNTDVAVSKANQTNAELTVGIVTDVSASELSYSDGQKDEVLVANTGQVQAFVSDVNGVPKSGDLLVPSPLDGILMKADDGTNGILGAIANDFLSDSAKVYKLKGGQTAKISIAQVNLDIHPVNKPNTASGLQDYVSQLVGHQVNIVQAVVATSILSLTIIVAGGMTYAAIANYLIAIGRNPMAKNLLRRGIFHVMGFVFAILAVGFSCGLAVLWL